ncbi:ATP-binding protein [Nonomuraea sp. MCN248]|uniref:ATP-binding protein n=1 Tax=Nonomuraea corallina TaxID=2989783 RepID=A0ABT4SCV8_9ACTN|nr:ATP-binding protein [Nonomuraea corallina]MDA0634800.1 ATP-binding protein [Nonomuraea corallina]
MADELEPLLSRDFDRDSLVALRREVERRSEQEGLAGLALYRFVVAVNEITTNAVRHGGGSGRLSLWKGPGRLRCEVTDRGGGLPAGAEQAPAPPSTAANGRGLLLARHGASRIDVRSGADGTSVVLEVNCP